MYIEAWIVANGYKKVSRFFDNFDDFNTWVDEVVSDMEKAKIETWEIHVIEHYHDFPNEEDDNDWECPCAYYQDTKPYLSSDFF